MIGTARTRLTLLASLGLALISPALGQGDGDKLRAAKALFFDRKYAEARVAWQAIRSAGGAESGAATYWIARCSESLGEKPRALREYAEYIALRGHDPALAEEAETSRVSLAAQLYKSGSTAELAILRTALADPRKTVRYFAALQLAGLGCDVGREAFPVLRRILAEETDPDLLERAKLAFLRCDPKALHDPDTAAHPALPGKPVQWLKVRVFKKGGAAPEVSINLPVFLAELAFKSLPDDAKRELGRQGYDADNFWERLRKLGPTQILEITDADGGRVQIWTE
jgi:hypothetical protein